jgi:ribosome biogenesis GTPase / thiamine phosphate phosphatase
LNKLPTAPPNFENDVETLATNVAIDPDLGIGRVASVSRNRYEVITKYGTKIGICSGHLLNEHTSLFVGDWIQYQHINDTEIYIVRLLPRKSLLARGFSQRDGQHAKNLEKQGIAANLDCIYIVTSLDSDFSLRRLERYLACCFNAKTRICIILSKTDKTGNVESYLNEVAKIAPGIPVLCLSVIDFVGFDLLNDHLQGTVCFLGSSGVGKSTIVNHLLGAETQKTGLSRAKDDKGRHTTSSRDLFYVGEYTIIDNPGLREIQVWADEEDIENTFQDIEALAINCQFHDCGHGKEKNCAVQEAVKNGTLSVQRLENYRAILREVKLKQYSEGREHVRKTEKNRQVRINQSLRAKGKRP